MSAENASLLPLLAAVVFGGAAGVGLGFLAPSPSSLLDAPTKEDPIDAVDVAAQPVASSPRCAARAIELDARIDAAETELDTLELQERLLRSQLSLIGGLPSEWTDDIGPEWREDAVREALSAADERVEHAWIVEVDCSEYPCIAIVEHDGPTLAAPGTSVSDVKPLVADWPGRTRVTGSEVQGSDGSHRGFGVIALYGDGIPDATGLRTDVRMTRHSDAIRAAWKGTP